MYQKNLIPEKAIRQIGLPRGKDGAIQRVPEYFGCNVFSLNVMKKRLGKSDFEAFERVVTRGEAITVELAEQLAQAVKDWASEQGVTHYCHWFQPQTGSTAEKHDAFIDYDEYGNVIEKFGAWSLIQGEPDASSFPSGGIRSTFEARGYTGWDPRSPMFIIENENGKTLYIPSVFLGYHGESLDIKTPLLKSNNALKKQLRRLLTLIGEESSERNFQITVGPEQEFFVIDQTLAKMRPDLRIAGRTVIGREPAKSHELDDHYFASIPSRVQAMLNELEYELYRVGIPLKTRHNEVAPCQFEVAPIYEEVNVAADHNFLLMKLIKVVGDRHGFDVLLHEKPFAGMNGSGKHVNWSVSDDTGRNYLDPGKTPHENLLFLTFLSGVMKGIRSHEIALRASIATYGNDYRLGANEAPPAIISIFLGDVLSKIMDGLESGGEISVSADKALLDLGLEGLQNLRKDNTDRNRTSPFAFTGNKFEFRAVGSTAAIGLPVSVLNGAVAAGLKNLCDRIESVASGKPATSGQILSVLQEIAKETSAIRFEGDGYSGEWKQEAESRGLSHNRNTPAALSAFLEEPNHAFLIEQGVYTQNDIISRGLVQAERYVKHQLIEMRVAIEMVESGVLPAAQKYLGKLARSAVELKELGLTNVALDDAKRLAELVNSARKSLEALKLAVEKCSGDEALSEELILKTAHSIVSDVLPKYEELRASADALEGVIPTTEYPYPSYDEMLFNAY